MLETMEMNFLTDLLRRPPETVTYATTNFQKVKLNVKKEKKA